MSEGAHQKCRPRWHQPWVESFESLSLLSPNPTKQLLHENWGKNRRSGAPNLGGPYDQDDQGVQLRTSLLSSVL